jgi:hypothetical protein
VLVHKESKELRVLLEFKELPVLRELKELKDLRERKDLRAVLEFKGRPELREQLEQVFRELKELPALKVQLAHKEQQALKE